MQKINLSHNMVEIEIEKKKENLKWYVFKAKNKEGEKVTEKIPAYSEKEAIEEIEKLGYTKIKIQYDYEF